MGARRAKTQKATRTNKEEKPEEGEEMKLFLDSANIEEIIELDHFIDGVTTNPSLLKSFDDIHAISVFMGNRPVSVEVTEMGSMLGQAFKLRQMNDNIVVKLPCTKEGLEVCKELSLREIPTNVTLVFSPMQAYLAMRAGATYISPFLGRLRDSVTDGFFAWNSISTMKDLRVQGTFNTEILVASIRSTDDVLDAAEREMDVATIPYKIMKEMFDHELTTKGLQKFQEDWHAKNT